MADTKQQWYKDAKYGLFIHWGLYSILAGEWKDPKTGEVKEHLARINPHDSYHFGKTEDCTDCHREHRPSVNDCATCHDVKAWNMKDPK